MDLGTIVGLVTAVVLIVWSILLGGNLLGFIDIPSILIVIGGGCIAAPLIAFPISHVKTVMAVIMKSIVVVPMNPLETIKFIVELAQKARKESLLALENVEISNPFLKKGITLAVDGTEPGTIKAILAAEMAFVKKRHENGINLLKFVAEMAPAFGMIGTLIGLVSMLSNMSDPASIGPAMSVAILTTLYGALAANVVCAPIAKKLEWYDAGESMQMQIVIEGISAILDGDHPAIAEQKLMSFLPAKQRNAG
jgi:chemotaxis protein MotA